MNDFQVLGALGIACWVIVLIAFAWKWWRGER